MEKVIQKKTSPFLVPFSRQYIFLSYYIIYTHYQHHNKTRGVISSSTDSFWLLAFYHNDIMYIQRRSASTSNREIEKDKQKERAVKKCVRNRGINWRLVFCFLFFVRVFLVFSAGLLSGRVVDLQQTPSIRTRASARSPSRSICPPIPVPASTRSPLRVSTPVRKMMPLKSISNTMRLKFDAQKSLQNETKSPDFQRLMNTFQDPLIMV